MEKLRIPEVTDHSAILEVIVEDYNRLGGNTFLGKVFIPLRSFLDKAPKIQWYKLRNLKNMDDGTPRGSIQLKLQWRFDVDIHKALLKKGKKGNFFGSLSSLIRDGAESDMSDADGENVADDDAPAISDKELAKQKEEQDKLKADQQEMLKGMNLIDGDYTIHAHIIEARDLKAENANGTSDPVVAVECFGQKFSTKIVWGVSSCVFDEVLIFQCKGLTAEEFENGVINISCRDANLIPGTSTMIGSYSFDATSCYFQKHHEMYRKWVPLMDDEDPDDTGVQGYLKISIQIVGPKDKQYIHDDKKELEIERAAELQSGGDIGSLVMMPPTIKKTWVYVVVNVFRAEWLPCMDGNNLLSESGTDAYFQLEIGNSPPVRTRIVTCKGTRANINPAFNYELWMPISIPTMTQMIKCSMWDHDKGSSNELIAYCFEKYNIIDRQTPKQTGTKWVNLYGTHGSKEYNTTVDNLVKGAKMMKKGVKQLAAGEINWKEFYNRNPDKGVSFKGRVLVNFRIENKRPKSRETDEIVSFRRKIKPLRPINEPSSRLLKLKLLIAMGCELPDNSMLSLGLINPKMYVKVTIGMQEMSTKVVENAEGVCTWNEIIDFHPMHFPTDPDQVPDVFVYLYKDKDRGGPLCYVRLKSKDLLTKGFFEPAKWTMLLEDKENDALPNGIFPGQVLLKIGFGANEDDDERSKTHWLEAYNKMVERQSYVLRVHVMQAKNLKAADSSIDFFLEI